MYSSVNFPEEWTIKEHPESWWLGQASTTWAKAVRAAGISIGLSIEPGLRFHVIAQCPVETNIPT